MSDEPKPEPPVPTTSGKDLKATEGGAKAAVDHISAISYQIREAIRAALPGPLEQTLTIMVPGKVVNFGKAIYIFVLPVKHLYLCVHSFSIEDYEILSHEHIVPLHVELSQARLCDDMPVIAPVQLGPSGRSVARSYVDAISKLVSDGSPLLHLHPTRL